MYHLMSNTKLRNLGKTNIQITPIGLGTWQFSNGKYANAFIWDKIKDEVRNEIVKNAIDSGINWFDTAEFYGLGQSERGLSASLQYNKIKQDEIKIATKWFPVFRFAISITKSIKRRLEALNPYEIDLYQIHQPYSFSSIKSQMERMAKLVELKHIKAVGVSNFSKNQMEKSQKALEKFDLNLASNQVKYSLLDREIEKNGVLDYAKEIGSTIIAYTPLEWGLLTGKLHDNPEVINSKPIGRRRTLKKKLKGSMKLMDTLKAIGNEINATPSQISLNWLTNFHGDTVVAIPGATKPDHIIDNAKSMSINLSKEQMNVLDELTQEQIQI